MLGTLCPSHLFLQAWDRQQVAEERAKAAEAARLALVRACCQGGGHAASALAPTHLPCMQCCTVAQRPDAGRLKSPLVMVVMLLLPPALHTGGPSTR